MRAWGGPWVHSPINAESIFALAVLVGATGSRARVNNPPHSRAAIFVVAAVLAYLPILNAPFISDDYVHILNASRSNWQFFTVPGADRFFRPLVMLSYAVDVRWAGFDPIWWHLGNLALHAMATVLVFMLCRELNAPGWLAAALFAVHAAHPEAVVWIAARFDLMATVFVLACIVLFLRFCRTGSWIDEAGVYFTCVCALLCKESAYVLPLLLALTLRTLRHLRPVLISLAITTVMFAYRWWLVGGIGGHYQTGAGTPMIFAIDPLRTAKGLFLRLWAALFFPINWSSPPEVWLAIAVTVSVAAAVIIAARASYSRQVVFGIAFTLIAALPVHQFLLIGPDLEKSRVLYLPSVGFCIAIAAMVTSVRLQAVWAAAILLLQVAALEHNLTIWNRVARMYTQACDEAARNGRVPTTDLPNVLDGIYFVKVGLPECVEMRH